jgi:hypothetical protein
MLVLLKGPVLDVANPAFDVCPAHDGRARIACRAALRPQVRGYRIVRFRHAGPGLEPFPSNCLDWDQKQCELL